MDMVNLARTSTDIDRDPVLVGMVLFILLFVTIKVLVDCGMGCCGHVHHRQSYRVGRFSRSRRFLISSARTETATIDGDDLSITSPTGHVIRGRRLSISYPTHAGMRFAISGTHVSSISTSGGDVGVDGNVDGGITTSSGDVTVKKGVVGNITTTSGNVNIANDLVGDVKTSSGDVTATKITGACETVIGDISDG